jgi:hypothetical protein
MRKLPLVLLASLLLSAAFASPARAPKPPLNTLVFTRHDGSTFTFANAKVSCGKSRNGGNRKAIFVDSLPSPYEGSATDVPYFFLEGVLRDVAPRGKVRFPHSASFGHPSGAEMFVFDRDDPAAMAGNELSSDQEESSGSIIFHKARCKPRARIAFTIDAKLGSEYYDLQELRVEGYFRGSAGS